MMVTCKWRLAALLCFLKTHAHQKVMVFFSTCDSVDFHALLFRETEWPQDLDAAIEGGGRGHCVCVVIVIVVSFIITVLPAIYLSFPPSFLPF